MLESYFIRWQTAWWSGKPSYVSCDCRVLLNRSPNTVEHYYLQHGCTTFLLLLVSSEISDLPNFRLRVICARAEWYSRSDISHAFPLCRWAGPKSFISQALCWC